MNLILYPPCIDQMAYAIREEQCTELHIEVKLIPNLIDVVFQTGVGAEGIVLF